MKVDERALKDVHTVGGGETPPCVGLTSNTLPKLKALFPLRVHKQGCPPEVSIY